MKPKSKPKEPSKKPVKDKVEDIVVKTDLTFEELLNKMLQRPPENFKK